MELPLIDFSPFISKEESTLEKPTSAQIAVAKQIDQANRLHGFVLLRNSGIPKELLSRTFDKTKDLFGLDNEFKKQKLKQWDHVTNSGYSPIGSEALNRRRKPDQKEAFNFRDVVQDPDVGLQIGFWEKIGSFCNPKKEKIPETRNFQNTPHHFEETALAFWSSVKRAGMKYAECCAIGLGLPIDYFRSTFQDFDLCTVRMLHYPPCPEGLVGDGNDGEVSIRLGEHTDFGAFTFLFVNDFDNVDSQGLQVKGVSAGEDLASDSNGKGDKGKKDWSDVIFSKKVLDTIEGDDTATVIVNTGALIARWTNDSWPATAHRVIVTKAAMSVPRYSIACFFDPDKESICSVHENFLSEGEDPKYEPISSFDYLKMKIKEAQTT